MATRKLATIKSLESLRKEILKAEPLDKTVVSVCAVPGCSTSGGLKVAEAFEKKLKTLKLGSKVTLRTTGCHGYCEKGPLVVIRPSNIFYGKVKPEDVDEIVNETIVKGKPVERLLFVDPATGKKVVKEENVPFYKKQSKILLGTNGLINPEEIEDYIRLGGYSALAKVLGGMKPETIIDEVKKAGLRGRGGAGFPAAMKWELCRASKGEPKYVVCNADEGDPGAYMNRSLLEGNPHSVLEGMLIGAYAIGASEGFVYVRHEYPFAVKSVKNAIAKMKQYGLLGKNILGSKFSFDVKVVTGAGAFICGEETALMASIEGKKGEPRQRPPFPSERGIWGKPTNINNVETWANVPLIINKGATWYSKIGTEKSKGTKIFSLVGKVNNTGLVEVPMGLTLKEMIYDIGGGIPNGKKAKAVQSGGPSGGCIPASQFDSPIDYESLKQLGAIMGSGGIVVMDEDTCMVDVAKYFLGFLLNESCGKCMTCREGLERMLEIVTDITEGKGKMEDIDTLKELGELTQEGSMCGLGQTAPNPLLSTIRHFGKEYEEHIKDKKCKAGVCKALINYYIDAGKCQACGLCKKNCPSNAITGSKEVVHIIDQSKCIKCDTCYDVCPDKFNAVVKISGEPLPKAVAPGTKIKKKAKEGA